MSSLNLGLIVVIIALLGGVFVLNDKRSDALSQLASTEAEFASTSVMLNGLILQLESDLAETQSEITDTIATLQGVQGNLALTQNEKAQLANDLESEKAKIGVLSDAVSSINNVVGDLNKLATTDEELLQKYSKVYFLNEHYIPVDLVLIEDEYVYNPENRYWFHRDAQSHLKQMMDDARDSGAELYVISAYRSFFSQSSLKQTYSIQYGEGANTFSADQGFSEHQLGTTLDFTDPEIGASYNGFEGTISYSWLLTNAYKYGFVLSYPPDNDFYIFEPWHWRFVGVDLATHLRNSGKFFYDEEQRIIDGYLINIFDPIGG